MSSELVKKLEDQKMGDHYFVLPGSNSRGLLVDNHNKTLDIAIDIVKEHEAKQMKEPFYQLTDKQEEALRLRKSTYLYFKSIGRPWIPDLEVEHAFTEWAIEQEKLEEEK